MATTNTLSTKTLRDKYRSSQIQQALKNSVIANKVCITDTTEAKTIQSPYMTQVTATVQAISGTYIPQNLQTNDDTLTLTDEVMVAAQIRDYETVISNFDLFFAANKAIIDSATVAVDKWVLNELCETGTGAYTTPVGGFNASNTVQIVADIIGKFGGLADAMNGFYIVIENTEMSGITQAQSQIGFVTADGAIRNGFMGHMGGADFYVVRAGTFVDETTTSVSGTKTWTNAGHRVGGIKNVATYAAPRGLKFTEKDAGPGILATEIVLNGLMGFKQWATKATLTVDITLA